VQYPKNANLIRHVERLKELAGKDKAVPTERDRLQAEMAQLFGSRLRSTVSWDIYKQAYKIVFYLFPKVGHVLRASALLTKYLILHLASEAPGICNVLARV
jgi:hypothetical protein